MNDMFKNGGILNLFTQNIKEDENLSLNKSAVADYSNLTITNNGHRSRHTSGIFLPKFCLSKGYQALPDTYPKAEFVEWLICGNKASNRTNNASRLLAVVETIPHPLQGGNHSLITNKRLFKMPTTQSVKTHQKQPPLHLATLPIFSPPYGELPSMGEVVHTPMEDEHIHQKSQKLHKSCNPEQKTILPAVAVFGYPVGVVAKSTTSREKLNDLSVANNSTPLIRAFFVRSLRTPNENTAPKNRASGFISMVGRIGQPLAVGCLPQMAVSHPDTSYRPAVRSQAVAQKSICGAITMLFKFLVLGEKRLTISIRAKSEQEARQKLQFTSPALCVARYNTSRSSRKGGIYA